MISLRTEYFNYNTLHAMKQPFRQPDDCRMWNLWKVKNFAGWMSGTTEEA